MEYNTIEQLKNYSSEIMKEETTNIVKTEEGIRAALPNDDVIYNMAQLFKVFGDPTRAKILSCLQIMPMNVGEIADVVDMSVSAVSHQLRVLRSSKLVRGEKMGKEVKYSLDDDHVTQILQCGLAHVDEER